MSRSAWDLASRVFASMADIREATTVLLLTTLRRGGFFDGFHAEGKKLVRLQVLDGGVGADCVGGMRPILGWCGREPLGKVAAADGWRRLAEGEEGGRGGKASSWLVLGGAREEEEDRVPYI
ncbi:hypothetical protein HPP92_010923 [Vanilla planifolia]|uniref:Uncharacterized protein n=1 Tax=Vanilla planifolia TaxID=51239 RepID=A0A835QUS0_VANPL|nr:hypothetical protein HPP92_010923 [Vanilla planifolia]